MLAAFQKHINTYFPELVHTPCLLAISGGKDSVVLAHLLHATNLRFSMAHVNFKLRAAASDGDQAFVTQLAAQFRVPLYTASFDTKNVAKVRHISTQMAARDLRYEWFKELQKQHKIPFVLTAHHLDDQIETFLINLNRGSGLDGMLGIPARNGGIIRPMLPFTQEQITHYARSNNLQWREDASNASLDYMRNAVRHKVLPVLYEVLPGMKANMLHTFSHAKAAQDLVGVAVARFRESELVNKNGNTYIPIEALTKGVNPAAYLYELLKEHRPNMTDVLGLLTGQTGKCVACGAVRVCRDREYLVISPAAVTTALKPVKITTWNKAYTFASHTITVDTIETADPVRFVKNNAQPGVVFIDAAHITEALILRNWQQGDKIAPYGMRGTKLVSKLIIDHKIPLIDKEKVVVLTYQNNILGVLGLRASKHFAVTPQTVKIIRIAQTS